MNKAASPPREIAEVADIKDYAESNASTARNDTSMFTSTSLDEESTEPVNSNIIGYGDGSSSEDEVRVTKSKVPVTHYNDLEELD